jgi:hypothetical protein
VLDDGFVRRVVFPTERDEEISLQEMLPNVDY